AFDSGLDGLRPRRGNEFVQVDDGLTIGGPADHELKGEYVRLIPATEMAGVGDRGVGVTGNEHAGKNGDRRRFLRSGDEGVDLALQRVDRLQASLESVLDVEEAHASFTRPRAYC